MTNIHVCLVSDQPIPNLTGALQFRPDRVVLLHTDAMREQDGRLKRILEHNGFLVESRRIEAYGLENVVATCEALVAEYGESALALNITGGTKIAALGAFQPFYAAGLPIYYVNTRDSVILRLAPDEASEPIGVTIGIREYLECYGFRITSAVTDFSAIRKRAELTRGLRDLAMDAEYLIGKLNGSFPADHKRSPYPLATAPLDARILALLPLMEKHAIARSTANGGLLVESVAQATYLRGGWFEELVAMAAKDAGADEVAMNVMGRWDHAGKKPPTNEFDVMLTKRNRLFLISCKTRYNARKDGGEGIAKEFLYELDSLGDQALGLFGGKMLANARPIRDDHVKNRARAMKIRIVDTNDLGNLKKKLREWLGK